MAGNVLEWVNDWYGEYPRWSVNNPTGPRDGTVRVLRGGSFGFSSDNYFLRVTARFYEDPVLAFEIFGFRCASSP
jgi:formylglycine-generating enzyme required for sulfatase activity